MKEKSLFLFLLQGRPNDTNKEFRKAREEGKIIVSLAITGSSKGHKQRVPKGKRGRKNHCFSFYYRVVQTTQTKSSERQEMKEKSLFLHTG